MVVLDLTIVYTGNLEVALLHAVPLAFVTMSCGWVENLFVPYA